MAKKTSPAKAPATFEIDVRFQRRRRLPKVAVKLEHDGHAARCVGKHKGCRLGQKNSVVLWVSAPHPYYVCGCDARLAGREVVLSKTEERRLERREAP